jgi:SAM-dependent methyltransferase
LRDLVKSLRRRALFAASGIHRPISGHWGYDRGQPIDRWYIERFLESCREDVRGDALEVKSADYVRRYGSGLRRVEVLDVDESNDQATVVGDLSGEPFVEAESFDCFVLTQTLQYVFDLDSAIRNAHRVLRPGGVLLVTVPALSRLTHELELDDFWRFTTASIQRLLAPVFGSEVNVATRGNLVSSIAFLTGLAAGELTERELAEDDLRFPVVVTARAVRA